MDGKKEDNWWEEENGSGRGNWCKGEKWGNEVGGETGEAGAAGQGPVKVAPETWCHLAPHCYTCHLLPMFALSTKKPNSPNLPVLPSSMLPLSSNNSLLRPPSRLHHSTSAFLCSRSFCSPSKSLSSSSWSLQILAILWGPTQASGSLKHYQLTLRSPLSELWPRCLPWAPAS